MSNEPAAPVIATPTDEIFAIAEVLGDIKTRFERVETEHSTQRATMEAAATALNAALTGLKTLQHHVLDNSIGALGLRVEEQRKAIDEQLAVVIAELKKADEALSAKTDATATALRKEFGELVRELETRNAKLETECSRIQLEAKRDLEKLAMVPGPMGPAGASMSPMGTWAPGKYPRLAVVSLMGSSYLSQVDDNEEKPTPKAKKWQVLAQRGSAGGGVPDLTSIGGVLTIAQGGTGATTKAAAATAIGVGTGDSPEFTGVTISGATASKLLQTDANKAAASVTLSGLTLSAGTLSVDAASTGAAGKVELATDAETVTGTDATRGVTPAGLTARLAAPGAIGGTTPAAGTFTTVKLGSASGPDVASSLAARGPMQGLVFDGSADSDVSSIPAFGSGAFSVSLWVYWTNNGATAGTIFGGVANAFSLRIVQASGLLLAAKVNAIDLGPSTTALTAGKWAHVGYTRTGTTGTFYVNGVAAGTTTDAQNYSDPVTIIGNSQDGQIKGTIAQPLIYNRALTAAEVLSLTETGAPSGADYPSLKGASAAGATATSGALVVGVKYRITTYNASDDFTNVGAASNANGVEFTATGTTPTTWTASSVVTTLGLLLAPDAQEPGVGYQWHDQSGNAANILLPATGVTWALPTSQPTKLRGATVHSGSGNIQLLGAACIPIGHHITAVRAKASTGTPTVYIGNASGDNSYVQAVALSTSWKVLTVVAATAITTTTAVWVNSDAAATISLDISHEPVSA